MSIWERQDPNEFHRTDEEIYCAGKSFRVDKSTATYANRNTNYLETTKIRYFIKWIGGLTEIPEEAATEIATLVAAQDECEELRDAITKMEDDDERRQ